MKRRRETKPELCCIPAAAALILTMLTCAPAGKKIGIAQDKQVKAPMKSLVIAHRGASGLAPENTLAAVQKAMALKADMIEIDVHQTQDSVIVVIHDDTIDRTTDGKGKVRELSFREIRKYDAGSWFHADYRGEKIPALEEVLETIQGSTDLLIEIKGGGLYPGIERRVVDLVNRHKAKSWCCIQSFDEDVLDTVHAIDPGFILYRLFGGEVPVLPLHIGNGIRIGSIPFDGDMKGIGVNVRFVSEDIIQRTHEHGLEFFVWTVDDADTIRWMIGLGVDGVITNFPDRFP